MATAKLTSGSSASCSDPFLFPKHADILNVRRRARRHGPLKGLTRGYTSVAIRGFSKVCFVYYDNVVCLNMYFVLCCVSDLSIFVVFVSVFVGDFVDFITVVLLDLWNLSRFGFVDCVFLFFVFDSRVLACCGKVIQINEMCHFPKTKSQLYLLLALLAILHTFLGN